MSDQSTSQPKLRWYQYRLRTLLLLVTVVAVFMSWFTVKMQQAKRQKEIINKLEYVIGFSYDYQFKEDGTYIEDAKPYAPAWLVDLLGIDFFASVVSGVQEDGKCGNDGTLELLTELLELRDIQLSPPELTDRFLEKLSSLKKLRSIDIESGEITDAGIATLKTLSCLEELQLNAGQITGAGLGELKTLPHLKSLSLQGAEFSDAGLESLNSLSHLENLGLYGDHLTDAVLEHLKGMKDLRILHVEFESFTGIGLKHLTELKQLQELSVNGSDKISDVDLQYLAELPQLKILYINFENTQIQKILSNKVENNQKGTLHFKKMKSLHEFYIFSEQKIDVQELECLVDFPRLKKLVISDNQLTESSLAHLKKLSQIEEFFIYSTQISDTGATEFKKLLPNATINDIGRTGGGMGLF